MEKGYGWLAGALRMVSKADGVVLVVLGGVDGNGYQFTGDPTTCRRLPEVLRDVANNIEADLEEGSRVRADRRAKDAIRAAAGETLSPQDVVVEPHTHVFEANAGPELCIICHKSTYDLGIDQLR